MSIDDIVKVVMDKHGSHGYEDSDGKYRIVDYTVEQATEVVKTIMSVLEASKSSHQPVECRQSFEAWWRANSLLPTTGSALERSGEDYRDFIAQNCWLAWQGAWKPERESGTPSERELHLFTELGKAQIEINALRALNQEYANKLFANWQPIETAPRDGTFIITYTPTGERRKVRENYVMQDHGMKGRWGKSRPDESPTHWMPFPNPPTNQIEVQEGK